MSEKSNIQRLPVEIDPFRLVEQGRLLNGRIPVSDFPRLKEQLFGEEGAPSCIVNVALEFTRTDTRLPVVKGHLSADLPMTCQRCLKGKPTTFETQLEVVLVSNDAQAEKLQGGFDTWLVEEQTIFLRDFIEDEILLALPLVILHDECDPARALIEALPEDELDEVEQTEENPFAVLKDLKLN